MEYMPPSPVEIAPCRPSTMTAFGRLEQAAFVEPFRQRFSTDVKRLALIVCHSLSNCVGGRRLKEGVVSIDPPDAITLGTPFDALRGANGNSVLSPAEDAGVGRRSAVRGRQVSSATGDRADKELKEPCTR